MIRGQTLGSLIILGVSPVWPGQAVGAVWLRRRPYYRRRAKSRHRTRTRDPLFARVGEVYAALVGRDTGEADVFDDEELAAALRDSGIGVWDFDLDSGDVRSSREVAIIFDTPVGSFPRTLDAYLALVHPGDRSMVANFISDISTGSGEPYSIEHRTSAPEGMTKWVKCRGRVRHDHSGRISGLMGTVVDITEQRETLDALSANEEKLRLFSDLASDYVYVAEVAEGNLAPSIVAGSFERTTGFTPEQVAERGGWLALVQPDDRRALEADLPKLYRGENLISEYRITNAAGETRWLRDHVHPIHEGGTLVRLVGGVQDITAQKHLEERLLQAQKMEALARLAGGVGHDFNNLLTVIYAAVRSLEGQLSSSSPALEAVADISQAAQRGAELTRSLLRFARKSDAHPAGIRLSLADIVETGRPMLARALGERIKLDVTARHPGPLVFIEPGQLQLVLLNLAMNAKDAMPDGGTLRIAVSVEALADTDARRPAEIAAGQWAMLTISDSGLGMRDEVRRHIFEPFFTTKAPTHGTGLGLAICHGIVRQAGGGISVHSSPGKGTCFQIFLPVATGPEGKVERSAKSPALSGSETILLVEDDDAIRRLLAQALVDQGYQVHQVRSAEEALDLDAQILEGIDLLLSDVRLPGVDGAQLAEMLTSRRSGLRVLLISGFVEDRIRRSVIDTGMFKFLAKPFSPDSLSRRVRETLDELD